MTALLFDLAKHADEKGVVAFKRYSDLKAMLGYRGSSNQLQRELEALYRPRPGYTPVITFISRPLQQRQIPSRVTADKHRIYIPEVTKSFVAKVQSGDRIAFLPGEDRVMKVRQYFGQDAWALFVSLEELGQIQLTDILGDKKVVCETRLTSA